MPLSVICGRCKSLVEIEDRRYPAHEIRPGEACPVSRSLYRAQVIHKTSPSGPPRVEVVSSRITDCPNCGMRNGGIELLVKVLGQKAGLN